MDREKLIIDTDVGSDCDDVAALALAAWMDRTGQAELLCVTHTCANPHTFEYMDSILRFYGDREFDLGVCDEKHSVGSLRDEFIEAATEGFLCRKPFEKGERIENSVHLLRRKLAENTGIKLVCIGPLNNIAALLESSADDISPLDGKTLLRRSVKEIVIMGGIFDGKIYRFGEEIYDVEFNIRSDIKSAKKAIEESGVPATFVEFELGYNVESFERTVLSEYDSPIRRSYRLFGLTKRSSWDPIAVLYSKYGLCGGLYRYSPRGSVTVDGDGNFTFARGGLHRYLIENAPKAEIVDFINSFESKIIKDGGIL